MSWYASITFRAHCESSQFKRGALRRAPRKSDEICAGFLFVGRDPRGLHLLAVRHPTPSPTAMQHTSSLLPEVTYHQNATVVVVVVVSYPMNPLSGRIFRGVCMPYVRCHNFKCNVLYTLNRLHGPTARAPLLPVDNASLPAFHSTSLSPGLFRLG